jgi:hypothetical protein
MIELIVLGAIQGVCWTGIGIYRFIEERKKRREERLSESSTRSQRRRTLGNYRNHMNEELPKYLPRCPTYEMDLVPSDEPPSYLAVTASFEISPTSLL